MTIDEFKMTKWMPRMAAIYQGKRYQIAMVCFDESLIGLDGVVSGSDDPHWARCENVILDGRWEA